jgi:hypothetical protein
MKKTEGPKSRNTVPLSVPEGDLDAELHLDIVNLLKTSHVQIDHHRGGTILRQKNQLF